MDKPAEMFGPRAMLGVVSGRRRQGKTFLLDALTRANAGFMFTATETTEADALRHLLTARDTATDTTRLQCYSGAGFTGELRRRAESDPTIQLIDPLRLYHGD